MGVGFMEVWVVVVISGWYYFLIHFFFFFLGERTIFKCRFCCAVATYFCGGMCHYCDPCHDKAGDLTDLFVDSISILWNFIDYSFFFSNGWKTKDASKLPKCPGKDKCPLGIDHPPNGVEFPIGCSVCRERVFFPLFFLFWPVFIAIIFFFFWCDSPKNFFVEWFFDY